jgi:rRNA-processing protein FCF1
LDGTFVVAVVQYNLPLLDRLDRLLQHCQVQLYITASSLEELSKLSERAPEDKVELFKQAHQFACKHCQTIQDIPSDESSSVDSRRTTDARGWKDLSAAGQDLLRVVAAADNKYFVASQDEAVLDVVRRSGSVPVIRLARGSVLLLEQPSKGAAQQDSREERQKWSVKGTVTEQEKMLVACVKEQEKREKRKEAVQGTGGHVPQQQRRKQKAKGPNPLATKKKRASGSSGQSGAANKRQRK